MEESIGKYQFVRFRCTRNQLKLLMAVTMVADHVGYMLVPPLEKPFGIFSLSCPPVYYILRLAGRLAFPLVCFFLVQGMRYTRDRRKYLLRLFLFALLSEIPFDLAIHGRLFDWRGQNVLFTLAISLCVLCLLEWAEQLPKAVDRIRVGLFIVGGGMLSAYILRTDYSYWGILMALIFSMNGFQRKQRFLGMLILCACQGMMQLFAVAALFFTENCDAGKVESRPLFGRYFFYWFYPLHFLVLFGLQLLIK